jgi:dTDP-4-amino-4,6-dideoxygalactose transaminase
VLSLPMFPDLSFEEQQQVAYALKDCLHSSWVISGNYELWIMN